LEFFAHNVHVFVVYDDDIEIVDEIHNESFVIDGPHQLRANAAAEAVAFVND